MKKKIAVVKAGDKGKLKKALGSKEPGVKTRTESEKRKALYGKDS